MEEKIREVAYRIWEEEGCPHGRDSDHWAMAEVIVLEETKKTPKKTAKKKAPAKKKTVAKKKAPAKKVTKKVAAPKKATAPKKVTKAKK